MGCRLNGNPKLSSDLTATRLQRSVPMLGQPRLAFLSRKKAMGNQSLAYCQRFLELDNSFASHRNELDMQHGRGRAGAGAGAGEKNTASLLLFCALQKGRCPRIRMGLHQHVFPPKGGGGNSIYLAFPIKREHGTINGDLQNPPPPPRSPIPLRA